jgi:hypothetical protein
MGLPRSRLPSLGGQVARNDKKGRLAMTTAQLLNNFRKHRIDASEVLCYFMRHNSLREHRLNQPQKV